MFSGRSLLLIRARLYIHANISILLLSSYVLCQSYKPYGIWNRCQYLFYEIQSSLETTISMYFPKPFSNRSLDFLLWFPLTSTHIIFHLAPSTIITFDQKTDFPITIIFSLLLLLLFPENCLILNPKHISRTQAFKRLALVYSFVGRLYDKTIFV
jgi:hypothetical protein